MSETEVWYLNLDSGKEKQHLTFSIWVLQQISGHDLRQ